jgi:acetylornithine deacetylase/succinyl-diaminopimelate desuccinylase-like protein
MRGDEPLDAYLLELGELIAIPTVSADPARREDVRAGAEWVCRFVERAGGSARLEADGVLAVGELRASTGSDTAPAVLLYGHFDVQPPEPLELWESDPFAATVRDGWLHGRGATDDKGQFFMLLRAAADLAGEGALPVNVLVLGDGEEEVGGTAAWDLLAGLEPRPDAAIVFDGPSESGGLELFLGTRGLLAVDVRVRTGEVDLHSGHYGGVALNAVNVLVQMLGAVLPRDGMLRHELWVGVTPPTEAERAAWPRRDPAEELRRRGARPLPGALDAYEERRWAEPSLDLNGILGGKPGLRNTSIFAEASAELSVRLVPDQRPAEVAAAVEHLLRGAAPPGAEVELEWEGTPAARIPAEGALVRRAAAALESALGERPLFVRSGGTLPVFSALAELGIPSVLMGFGVPEGNQHAPNERLPLASLPRGIRAGRALLSSLADLPS